MTLEEDLRVALHDRAAAATPPADDLLTEVTKGYAVTCAAAGRWPAGRPWLCW
ncbi:hypothetical protein [Actinoplanes sp. CA-252034]|uniref:hypothetical protein n=1 Tax=Actinoplanes sp. CA-252034 TaxID=3239906 RepID=UPI003D984BAC